MATEPLSTEQWSRCKHGTLVTDGYICGACEREAAASSMLIAALYVQKGGIYYGLPGVDPWDAERDARNYSGPYPVVAHPPCSRWCQLAHVNQKRYGHKVGDDGGMFAHALDCVRRFGGVLEHPAQSYAWAAYGLARPRKGMWLFDGKGWTTEVAQRAYGHRARKATWLYYVGPTPPPLQWEYEPPAAWVGFCKNHGDTGLPRLSKKEASATPPAFRDLLIALARATYQAEERAA